MRCVPLSDLAVHVQLLLIPCAFGGPVRLGAPSSFPWARCWEPALSSCHPPSCAVVDWEGSEENQALMFIKSCFLSSDFSKLFMLKYLL